MNSVHMQCWRVFITLWIFSFSGLVAVSPCGLLLECLLPCMLVGTALNYLLVCGKSPFFNHCDGKCHKSTID